MVNKDRKSLKSWLEKKKKKWRTDLLSDFYTQFTAAVKENNESFLLAFEDFLNTNRKYEDSFVLEKVFKFVQHCGDIFFKRIYYPLRKKVIQINVFDGFPIKKYILPKSMNDTNVQNNTLSNPMGIAKFWAVWYLLTIDPNRGKESFGYELQKDKIYLLHVALSTGEVSVVRFIYNHKEDCWKYFARDFDCKGGIWGEGSVFLYF
jgi:hypothetical protein